MTASTSGWSDCRPRRATWPRRCAGTWPTTAVRCRTRSTPFVTLCLAAYARLAFGEGDPERTALLEGAADGLRRRVGLHAWPMLRPTETELTAQLRKALGSDRFDQAFAAGPASSQTGVEPTAKSM